MDQNTNNSLREEVFRYVKKKYNSEIEYLWTRFPTYAIFRHSDNKKWYGLVMDIPCSRLGLPGEDIVDVLNVKLDNPLLRDLLIQQDRHPIPPADMIAGKVPILQDQQIPK